MGTLSQASHLLAEAVQASGMTGKRASVTLTLTVEPKQGALNFVAKLTSRMPSAEEPLCIFYADSAGNLHRDDPRQKELALRAYEGGQAAPQLQEEAKAS